MPPFVPPPRPPDRRGAAADIATQVAGPRVSTNPADLIRDAGGTRAAAALTGVSQRTMQRRAAGQGPLAPAQRGTLARAGQTLRTARMIESLGGAKAVAALTGRSLRTVQRWASGQIRQPRADARNQLGRADVSNKLRTRGLDISPTGVVARPTTLHMKADVRVKGNSNSPEYVRYGRTINVQMDPDVMQAFVEALGRGDHPEAHALIEEFLSTGEYSGVTAYSPEQDIGFFINNVDNIDFSQDS